MPDETPKVIKARRADKEEVAEWRQYQREARQKAPERIEDAAKFLSGMISISFTIFLKANPEGFKGVGGSTPMVFAVVLWLLSLLAAFMVLFPVPFRYSKQSLEDIQRMHGRVVRYKYGWLIASALLFVGALGVMAWVYVGGSSS
ncbi:MAG: hypothetical protein H6557_00375 [Lewinellaceae bacterium]|nr:hypothetical protein [Lewinellaceae bacterium]